MNNLKRLTEPSMSEEIARERERVSERARERERWGEQERERCGERMREK
jgi:hypothetical protein